MRKLYMYSYKKGKIERISFDVNKCNDIYMPITENDNTFFKKYGMYPPIDEDLNCISEIAIHNDYIMFSLTENDNLYKELLCAVFEKELQKLENSCNQMKEKIQNIGEGEVKAIE